MSEQGDMIGTMSTPEALDRARAAEKDLVLVTDKAKPPIVKIIDLAKYKYQLQQKEADNRKKSKTQDIKEMQFSPFIGEADYQTKLRRVHEFLGKGDKVRLVVDFKRGRAITKKEFGYEILNQIFAATEEVAAIEIQPNWQGKKLMAQLMPGKRKTAKPETGETPVAPTPEVAPENKAEEVNNTIEIEKTGESNA